MDLTLAACPNPSQLAAAEARAEGEPPAPETGKALLITDEQSFPHPAKHRLRNAK